MSNTHGELIAKQVLASLHEANVSIVTALPESLLKTSYHVLEADKDIRYVLVSNEADMAGIAAGAYLGGKRAVMMMENSGIRQACEAVARLTFSHQIPLVMIMAYRGDLGEGNWWGHSHAQTMTQILDALRIPYWFVGEIQDIQTSTARAWTHAESSQWPVALIYRDECVEGSA